MLANKILAVSNISHRVLYLRVSKLHVNNMHGTVIATYIRVDLISVQEMYVTIYGLDIIITSLSLSSLWY